ncbi:NitT/TauT family transport system permease protein [Micromonospora sp. Llam0]|uniref:ABC transporter permease n=1 Tax=Micromonospora sp. Llam0 TaxID=2485143 RepID=UPI000F47EFF6|nr:ABC transporter permease [Micromonospora sp. Llam0]ROO58706.1 NitT/TauT family transport system permease protein [Micromonospora sp. Llam0]
MNQLRNWRTVALAIPVPVLLLIFWELVVRGDLVANLPGPVEVFTQFGELLGGRLAFDAPLGEHIWQSARRVLTGFGIACLIAVPLGVLMGRSPRLSSLLDPTVNLLRPIPVTAWAPLMVVIVGIGSKSAIVLIVIATFYPVLLNTIAGVRNVPPRLLEAAAMLGTARHRVLWQVVLPAALPSVFAGMRIGLGFAWVIVVVGETVGVQTGLGALITQAWQVSRTDLIITGMLVIGLAGFLSDKGMSALWRLALRNRPLGSS